MGLAGEYAQPQVRESNLRIPTVVGYTTGRLRAQLDFLPVEALPDNTVMAVIFNSGPLPTTIQFEAAYDYSSSGVRTPVGTPVSLVAGGLATVEFDLVEPYLEVKCVGGDDSDVDIKLHSQIQFDVESFSKGDPFYPPQIWEANYTDID